MNPTESTAVAACQRGDLSAFDTLYMQHVSPVFGYLRRRTSDRETAEDLTSQTFLKAIEGIRSFNPDRGTLRGWLFSIARNLLIDHVRRLRPIVELEYAETIPDDIDIVEGAHMRLQIPKLREALSRLTPIQREVVTLRVWEGLPYAEIAGIVGKSEGNCKVLFSRAVDALRETLPWTTLVLFLAAR